MISIKYECHDIYAEVTFNVDGKEYSQQVSGDVEEERTGKVLPDRAYRCRNKLGIMRDAWGILRSRHEELECMDEVSVKIEEMVDISCPPNCPKLFHL